MTTTQAPHSKGRDAVRIAALGGMIALAVLGVTSPVAAAGPTLGPNLLQNGGFEEPALTAPSFTPFNSTIPLPGWEGLGTENGSVQVSTVYDSPTLPNTPATHVDPAEGNQFIGLIGNPDVGYTAPGGPRYSLYQQFPTEIGKTYQVSYWAAGGPNVDTLCVGLLCSAGANAGDSGGGNAVYFRNYYPTDSTWVRFTDTYVATKSTGVVSIGAGADPGGVAPLFDGVSVQEVIPAVVDTPIASAPVVLLGVTVAGVALGGVLAVLGWRRRVAVAAR